MNELGVALRAARLAAGVSLSVMAERTHYSKGMLSHLETGKRSVSTDHVAAYEAALGVRIGTVPGHVGATDVGLLSQSTDTLTALGLRHGGIAVAEMARAQWNLANGLLGQSMTDDVRTALSAQSGRLADRVAWTLAEAGRATQATKVYGVALDLSAGDHELHALVVIDLAQHMTDQGSPQDALDLLSGLSDVPDVHQFTANGVRANAYATLGDRQGCLRHVGMADDAWSRVSLDNLPETHRPYMSGHQAHAHREAGRALSTLAMQGEKKTISLAVQRLELAVASFGPDRARAIARCQERLRALVG